MTLKQLATLTLITTLLLSPLLGMVSSVSADTQSPICWVRTIEGDVVNRDGTPWLYGGRVTIEDNMGDVLAETGIDDNGDFLITYGENMAPAGTPLYLEISYGSALSGLQYSEFLENSTGDDLEHCIFTVEERTFSPGDGTPPTAVSISKANTLHPSTFVPLFFIANAFFLTGATLFAMAMFPPVTSNKEEIVIKLR